MGIGKKIKERRTLLMLTQQELANRCELTKGYISQLENDKVSPSIETLEIILDVLGTNFTDFFKNTNDHKIIFTKDEQYIKSFDNYNQTWLIPTSQEYLMEPILVEIMPNGETFHDYPHPGEEFGYVLSGSITIHLGKKRYKAKKGESFYFTASTTHYIEANAKTGAVLIWISSPPSF